MGYICQWESYISKLDVMLLQLDNGDKIVICSDGVLEKIDVVDLVKISEDFNEDKLKYQF